MNKTPHAGSPNQTTERSALAGSVQFRGAAPKFAVVRNVPYFDDRDCIRGWSRRTIAMTMTQGFAHVIQAREDGDGMDETTVDVVEIATGKRVFRDLPTDDSWLLAA